MANAPKRKGGGLKIRPEDEKGLVKASEAASLLKVLHIMNADGSISADMRRKFNQINHLAELFVPTLREVLTRPSGSVLDANCGNAYLSFLLAHVARHHLGAEIRILGIDRSPARIETCRERARSLGFDKLQFECGDIRSAAFPEPCDFLISLHGCDVATDHALLRAVQHGVPFIHVVPCCQHEVRPLLREDGLFASFLQSGIIADDFAANLTDVLRLLWLRTQGYRAECVEFVPLEHSMKNRLIRAKFTRRRDEEARAALESMRAALRSDPLLLRGTVTAPSCAETGPSSKADSPE